MKSVKDKAADAYEIMKPTFGYKNKMQAPKIQKVVISVGTGGMVKKDKTRNDFVAGRLAKITGQKASFRQAKKSIASFKVRQGDTVGVAVTLRGTHMQTFIDKLLNIALPRTKDFRGLEKRIVDDIGNITIPVKEHTIFPETGDEELKDVFGMAITIVTSAKNKAEATKFFELIGVPFKK
jgi:large subunit ribosomal protein L5